MEKGSSRIFREVIKMIERIICGDNLEVLKTLESESVDLVYIDPPFFTKTD